MAITEIINKPSTFTILRLTKKLTKKLAIIEAVTSPVPIRPNNRLACSRLNIFDEATQNVKLKTKRFARINKNRKNTTHLLVL